MVAAEDKLVIFIECKVASGVVDDIGSLLACFVWIVIDKVGDSKFVGGRILCIEVVNLSFANVRAIEGRNVHFAVFVCGRVNRRVYAGNACIAASSILRDGLRCKLPGIDDD